MCLKMKFYCDDKSSDISTGTGMAILNKYNNAKCSFHGKFVGTNVDIAVTLPSCPLNEDSTFEVFKLPSFNFQNLIVCITYELP